jgi:pyridinium-3,5-biscarboxylic acid mononucleotide sulfurtransferase
MSVASMSARDKLDALIERVRTYRSVVVCYSGGIDSAVVLAVAHRALGEKAIGLTAVSPSLASGELAEAERIAKEIGANHRIVHSQEIENENYVKNGPDRCFYCKSELYRIAEQERVAWGLDTLANGTNMDDLGDHRPGLTAASRANVRSPMVELGLNKSAVRAIATELGLSIWDKPAAACLSSRIPYGTSVTRARLAQIDGLESALHALGFRRVRVRYHEAGADKAFARIELDANDIARAATEHRDAIVAAGERQGFLYVTLDLAGYRMGSHNMALPHRALPLIQS